MQSSITQFFTSLQPKRHSDSSEINNRTQSAPASTPPNKSKRKKPSTSSGSGSSSDKKKKTKKVNDVKQTSTKAKNVFTSIEIKKDSNSEEDTSDVKPTNTKSKNVVTSIKESTSSDEDISAPVNKVKAKKNAIVSDSSSSSDEELANTKVNKKSEEVKNTNEDKKVHSFFSKSNQKEIKLETVVYNPNCHNYHPINSSMWTYKEKVPYIALAKTLEEIENISARLKMIETLSNYFRSVIVLSPDDLLPSIYLCLNKLGPAYEGIELNVAETSLMKAIALSTGRTVAQIKADAKSAGDLGIVAEQSRNNQKTIFKPAPLTVRGVFEKFRELSKMTGNASQTKKVEKIQTMFVACKQSEARFLIRSLAGKLRIGLAEQSVLQALALACAMTPPNQEYPPEKINCSKNTSQDSFKSRYDKLSLILKTTYCECPNYDLIVPVLLKEGIEKLPDQCKLTPGIPLKPMLAHPTKGVQEVLTRFDGLKFTCEWKYDGERAQIHINENKDVNIYSRNQENNTSKYPDIISRLDNCKGESVNSCILDCEAVAWDVEKKQILPFQILSTRKRKDANEAEIKVQVCVFMFDLLYLNGESLVKKPFSERRSLLKTHFKEHEGQWCFATCMDTKTMEEVQEFLEESVKGNCEGLMVKTLDEEATYEIAKRSRNWLKLKKDYLEGVGDTLDVVVIGGYLGKGKRTGTYGGFLLACYDQDSEEYQSICKIGTGFTDESLQTHTEFLKDHILPQAKQYYRFDNSHEPDHWFDAVQVWEIKCADLSLSPVHRAGMGIVDAEKGISLRFPRFIRIRDDKTVEEATSAQQVAEMYSNQDQIKNQAGKSKITEEDFY